jgi:hypothetical protein
MSTPSGQPDAGQPQRPGLADAPYRQPLSMDQLPLERLLHLAALVADRRAHTARQPARGHAEFSPNWIGFG